jgi:hypothetical protein
LVLCLRADKPAEAEKAYREDLAQYPENGWSLYGRAKSLRLEGKAVDARFAKAWAAADIKIDSTCRCLPAAGLSTR